MTGVARAERGRGIAAAMKRHAIAWAAAHGLHTLEAENVEANAAIRMLNEQSATARWPTTSGCTARCAQKRRKPTTR